MTTMTLDPETPLFNELLAQLPAGEILREGGLEVLMQPIPDYLEFAFTIDPADFELANGTYVPTVYEIEDDIDAGLVPVVVLPCHWHDEEDDSDSEEQSQEAQGRHREKTDDDEEEAEEQADAASSEDIEEG